MFGLNWDKNEMSNNADWKEESGWSVSQGQTQAKIAMCLFGFISDAFIKVEQLPRL